ncbi:MAG: glycosyltransferase [Planctomycetales bacterium]|nr:glycosyltransferase [Planctomycetales bacterium]
MKHLLMIAYHYPPLAGSSGIQRTLCFSKDLQAHGWQPAVLGAHPRAFERVSNDLLGCIPADVVVRRPFALDARRHLSLFGRYPAWFAQPDRWTSWLLGALPAGLRMIRLQRPDVIWSTYPIPTAHLIGYWLSRLSGIPWVADFRDPMAHAGYPQNQSTWNSYLKVEQKVSSRAARLVFTTPGAARLYRERYPARRHDIRVIENGFDETHLVGRDHGNNMGALNPNRITLLHSGIVYPEWRNPVQLFKALQSLFDTGAIARDSLCVRFRAPEHVDFVSALAKSHGLDDVVQILPAVSYGNALNEMAAADGLLVLQSDECNDQIPAKVYEYFSAGKPILGLCSESSDTANLLRSGGCAHLAPLESSRLISTTLANFVADLRDGTLATPSIEFVRSMSRHSRAAALATLLDEVRP